MEVVQISRSISVNLGLNESLAEAIALGHDIGHTPFGHQGERILDDIMAGETDLGGKLKYTLDFGGFKHNYNSVKILDEIEVKYPPKRENEVIKGLNLTWQVKDGILKHTKVVRHKDKAVCKDLRERKLCLRNRETCFDINRFMQKSELFEECLLHEDPCTLEGQVVAIADEIAQRQHDIDDGLRDRHLGLSVYSVSEEIKKYITEITTGKDETLDQIKLLNNLKNKITKKENVIVKNDSERLYLYNSIVRDAINYFILDVTIQSIKNVNDYHETATKKIGHRAYITKNLIDFSQTGSAFNKKIEKFITNKIVNSETVNKFDGKSLFIVKQLFKAYYTNPRQMPKYVLNRLTNLLENNSKDYYPIKFKGDEQAYNYSKVFEDGSREDVERLISLQKLELDINKLDCPIESEFLRLYCKMENGKFFLLKDELTKINSKSKEEIINNPVDSEREHHMFIKCLIENHYAYMSTISDFISGMTDNYAIDQFENLYLV